MPPTTPRSAPHDPEPGITVPAEHDPDDPDSDIRSAVRKSHEGTALADGTLSKRARNVMLLLILVVVLEGIVFGTGGLVLYNRAVAQAVDQANHDRMDGAAQAQARDAYAASTAYNAHLQAEGLPELPVAQPGLAPPSDTINNAAAVDALGYLTPDQIRRGDLSAIPGAVDRYFSTGPVVSASGPSRFRMSAVMTTYIALVDGTLDPGATPAPTPTADR